MWKYSLYKVCFWGCFPSCTLLPLVYAAVLSEQRNEWMRISEGLSPVVGFFSFLARWRRTYGVYKRVCRCDFWPADQRPACLHSKWFLSVNPICVSSKTGRRGSWLRPGPSPVKQKAMCGRAGRIASSPHTCVEILAGVCVCVRERQIEMERESRRVSLVIVVNCQLHGL